VVARHGHDYDTRGFRPLRSFGNLFKVFFKKKDWFIALRCTIVHTNYHKTVPDTQGRPLGGASGALAPGADFDGAPKRRSPTGHTLIRSTVAW
jgi:hypothetical protein